MIAAAKKVGSWMKKWWKAVAGAVGATVVVGVGAFIAVGAYRRNVRSLRSAVEVERVRRDVAVLQGRKQEILAQDERDEEEIKEIEERLEINRQKIVETRRAANIPDDELAEELGRLGY
jgi:hypothetical protein